MRVILAVAGLLMSPLLAVATAQTVPPPLFDLSGFWELTEYGALLDGKPAIVEITHTGNTVAGVFVRGSECFNGVKRPDAFLAELGAIIPGFPPHAPMTGPAMWVCSNDPALLKKCGGAILAIYKTKITSANAELDYIEGSRVAQGVKDCSLDASEDDEVDFSLRRLTPCELEQRVLEDAKDEMVSLLKSILTAKPVFQTAIDAARQRFPNGYGNQPISVMDYPRQIASLDEDAVDAEALFAAMPDLFTSSDWLAAKAMVIAVGTANPPVLEASPMLDEMTRIERTAPDAQRVLNKFRFAREAERKCRQGNP